MKRKCLFISSILALLLSACSSDDLSMYYNLSLFKGIEVYTHVLADNKYEFGFMSGTNMIKRANDVNKLKYVDMNKGKEIIDYYGDKVYEDNLIVIIIPNPCTDEDLIGSREYGELEIEIKNYLLSD